MAGPGLHDEPTHAGQPGVGVPRNPTAEYPTIEPERTTWVGRARPPAATPPVDPYWPPLEQPQYGHPPYGHPAQQPLVLRQRRSGRSTFLLVVGIFAAICVVGSGLVLLSSALLRNAGTLGTESPVTPSPTVPPPPPEPGIGDAVRDGRFEFVVNKVQCGRKKVEAGFFNVSAQGQFCIVDFSVQNIGAEAQNFSDLFQRAYDADGTSYGANVQADLIANQDADAFWKTVQPGKSMTGKLVFDIPKKAKLAQLELHDSPFSSGAVITV